MNTVSIELPADLLSEVQAHFSKGGTPGEIVAKLIRRALDDETPATIRVDTDFMSMLKRLDAEGRHVSAVPGRNYAPAVFEQMSGGSITRVGYRASMDRLMASGKIAEEKVGPASRKRSRLVTV
jgi:hypothetical protein